MERERGSHDEITDEGMPRRGPGDRHDDRQVLERPPRQDIEIELGEGTHGRVVTGGGEDQCGGAAGGVDHLACARGVMATDECVEQVVTVISDVHPADDPAIGAMGMPSTGCALDSRWAGEGGQGRARDRGGQGGRPRVAVVPGINDHEGARRC
jgi:hypothetical protein